MNLLTWNKEVVTSVFIYFVTLLSLFSSDPFIFSLMLPIPPFRMLLIVFLFIYSIYLLSKKNIHVLSSSLAKILFIQSFVWYFFMAYHQDYTYFTRIAYMLIIYLSMLCLHNTSFGLLGFFKLLCNIVLLMAIGGCICFFLVLFDKINPIFEFSNVDGRSIYCFGLTCTNVYIANFIRAAGYFDEPGALAYWGIFALVYNRLFFYNKKFEVILMFCLIFTLSLAFYIQVFFYLLFFKIRTRMGFFLLTLCLGIIIGTAYLSKDTDYDIYQYTIQRFEVDETSDRAFKGDNRSGLAELAKKHFLKAPILGIGAQKMSSMEYMADNPYEILAKDGIIGMFVTYIPLIGIFFIGIKRKSYSIIFACIVLALGYLQRPFHINFMHIIMLYTMYVLINLNKNHTVIKS